MNIWRSALLSSLLFLSAGDASAQQRFYERMTQAEGDELIAKLQHLQAQLRAGRSGHFELHSGGPIGFRMTRISPRDAFLEIPFDDAWIISRSNKRSPDPWNRYTLIVPHLAHGLSCNVAIGTNPRDGKIKRVSIDWGAPPPGLPPPPPPTNG